MSVKNTNDASCISAGSFKERSLAYGGRLTNPPEGEDVVISGMAGKFPDADGVYELRDKLFNKIDLVNDDHRRWKPTHPEVPQRSGKLYGIEKFDAGFFGVPQLQADFMDPMLRLLFERVYEAIVDAGYHPSELAGSNTGVFVGATFTENELYCYYQDYFPNIDSVTGNLRSMMCNRLSYYFELKGPSFNCDTACSSSMFAFEHAYRSIRNGICDRAIVGTTQLCLHSSVSLQFARMGPLSPDGYNRSFDNDANGYTRAEGICALLLEKSKDARRIYAHVIHAKCNCEGYKDVGISFPSSEMQVSMLREFYEDCEIDPTSLTYVEAHGTATKVGDPEELNTIDEIFCKGRDTPLYIGSVKSNMGHNEPASGLCSIIKVLIAMETGFIPPNLHFKKNKEGIEAMEKGRIKVVTEKMAMPDDESLVGVNCFGFGGSISHVLLRSNKKRKSNQPLTNYIVPRLVCVTGRTRQAVETILNDAKNRILDAEYVKILHTVFRKDTTGHLYRGYSLIGKTGEIASCITSIEKIKKKICLVFTDFDEKWYKIGSQLSSVPLFAASVKKIQDILSSKTNINLLKILENSHEETPFEEILGTIAVQICLVDILKIIGIVPDLLVGIGTGELSVAYFEDHLSLREVILLSLYIGSNVKQLTRNTLVQHAVNLKKIVPDGKAFTKKWLNQQNDSNHNVGFVGFLQSLVSPVSFEETKLPKNSMGILIGPHVKNDVVHLVDVRSNDYVSNFLRNLGCLYINGCNMELDKLYPNVQWPVSRGTPMISPLIKWLHDKKYHVSSYIDETESQVAHRAVVVDTQFDEWSFVTGHVIDGRNLFPATAYLYIVWETLGILTSKTTCSMRVCFENVKFIRATHIPSKGVLELMVTVQKETKKFEITEGGVAVVYGKIYIMDEDENFLHEPKPTGRFDDEFLLYEKDIYKELKLRGYNYTGQFRGLKSCDIGSTTGTVNWSNNWISLMDCMLQMQILKLDTRNLYVPTRIQTVTIDAVNHASFTKTYADNILPVYYSNATDTISCGNVNIMGVVATSIPRRKKAEPVLETYKFVSNDGTFPLDRSVRIMTQIILENTNALSVKSVEIEDESRSEMLSPLVLKTLNDLPLIQSEIVVFSDKQLDLAGVTVNNKDFRTEKDVSLIIGVDIFSRDKYLDELLNVVRAKRGYVIARETVDYEATSNGEIQILCVHKNEKETLVLIREAIGNNREKIIDVTDDQETFDWLPKLQNAINTNERVVAYAYDPTNGVLGLVNCLRREPNGEKISCMFIDENAPKFDSSDEFYKKQIAKNFTVNVWKDSKWGTYRHLPLEEPAPIKAENCYGNVMVRGDLSSLRWMESSLKSNSVVDVDKTLVHVYYSAVNFKDVMIASGRISADIFTTNRIEQDCMLGFEFSGRDCTGKRVMGMVTSGALSTLTAADSYLLMPVPDDWSMEDAATVPVVYGTVIYAFLMRANLKHGQSVLIHSGTGGVGLAAIHIALHYGCTVFTTVGTQEKRDFIKKTFPQIADTHIGNSRDCSFEQMILEQTKGRGVDVVLNSLSEEKLLASVRCLAKGGKFCEIGKYDLINDNDLSMQTFPKLASFHGVMLDKIFKNTPENKKKLTSELMKCIKEGAVKPLPKTVFGDDELEKAYRFMSTGKHVGKVLIEIRKEEISTVPNKVFEGMRRFHCDPHGTYVILGGLGGFGLELADWLALRGARKLILTSRSGIKTGYQFLRLNIWKTYGARTWIRNDDASTEDGCLDLLKFANSLGPVKAIFNLAVVLKDALFTNQNIDNFKTSLMPKAYSTRQLDIVSRKMCPNLEYFVVFSSVSCGRGNAGQTNYGMANSIMERICERRKKDGYPALAIQWGAVGDVGLVADMQNDNKEMVIGGTLQQSISNCLQVLDKLLCQEEPIVASMVVAEKRARTSGANNIVHAVLNILGINDIKTISHHVSLPELGMDSMMGVEIKQTLEREYEVFLTPQDLRTMTISRLKEVADRNVESGKPTETKTDDIPLDLLLLMRYVGVEENSNVPVVRMKTSDDKNESVVYLLPGLEGMSVIFDSLANRLNLPAICLQFCHGYNSDSIESLARSVYEHMEITKNFKFVAYSFGCAVATELIHVLEQKGLHGKAVFIDGSHDRTSLLTGAYFQVGSDAEFQTSILCGILSTYIPIETILKHKVEMLKCETFEDRISYMLGIAPNLEFSKKYVADLIRITYIRLNASTKYEPNCEKFKSKVMLIRPTTSISVEMPDDYNLSKLFDDVDVKVFEGDHSTVVENPDVAEEINKFFEDD